MARTTSLTKEDANRSFDRIEKILDKQTEILDRVGQALTTLNHNSTDMRELIKSISDKKENKMLDIIKYAITGLIGAISAIVALKVI